MPLTAKLQARLAKRGLLKKDTIQEQHEDAVGCPNKWNPFHECNSYCTERWGEKGMIGNTLILPANWKRVKDGRVSHPYFWNTKTNEVSWYPPTDSKIVKGQEVMEHKHQLLTERVTARKRSLPYSRAEKSAEKSNKGRYRPQKDSELDPMDPAAYSEAPRGTWKTGLEQHGEAKTGVDTTASGPLYQQRPYPSPGDILKANRNLQDE